MWIYSKMIFDHYRLILVGTIIFFAQIGGAQVFGELVTSIESVYQDEVRAVVKDNKVQRAFSIILDEDDKCMADLITLTEIEAPPFKEDHRAQKFKEMLVEAGIEQIWIDQEGNVIGLRKGKSGKKTVVLDAHLDTVFPEGTDVKVRMSGDTLFAPGISDDTRGLAMVLAVVRALNKAEIETEHDILFVGSVGEEGLGDLRGVKYIFNNPENKIDSWISIDGGLIGRVNNKALGSYRYKVTFKGPGGHSWGAFGLANPHHALGQAISNFTEKANEFTSYGPRTSYNVGRIGGGTSINSIPFSSWMEIDIRSVQPERLDSMEVILEDAVHEALNHQNSIARRGYPLTVQIDKIGERPSGELSPDLPLIQRAMAATAYFGKRPELTRGSTNANIPISLGVPAITIGRGGEGGKGHSFHEWWMNKEGHKAIQLALLILALEAKVIIN